MREPRSRSFPKIKAVSFSFPLSFHFLSHLPFFLTTFSFLVLLPCYPGLLSRPKMNTSDQIEVVEIAKSRALSHDLGEKHPAGVTVDEASIKPASVSHNKSISLTDGSLQKEYPNEEDLRRLRRVPGKISWITYTVAFVELCERFSYYGTTAVCENSSSVG